MVEASLFRKHAEPSLRREKTPSSGDRRPEAASCAEHLDRWSSAEAVIDDMVHERQQHFVLPPFVSFWQKS